MERRTITTVVEYIDLETQIPLTEFIAHLVGIIEQTDPAIRPYLMWITEHGWEGDSRVSVEIRRPETDEEIEKRIADVAATRAYNEARNRALYEELKRRYDPTPSASTSPEA